MFSLIMGPILKKIDFSCLRAGPIIGIMTALVFGTLILLWIKKPKSPGEDFPTRIVVRVSITVLALIVVLVLLVQLIFTQVFLTASNGFETFIFTWSIFNYTTIFPCFLVDSMINLKQYFRDTLHTLKYRMFCSVSVGVIDVIV